MAAEGDRDRRSGSAVVATPREPHGGVVGEGFPHSQSIAETTAAASPEGANVLQSADETKIPSGGAQRESGSRHAMLELDVHPHPELLNIKPR